MHLAISVIIPTYNRKTLVTRAITSVLEQTYPIHEVLIIDDGSTDGTASAIQNFGDARVKYLPLSRNSGGAVARNIGIENSCGEYIAFLDSDDQWLPRKLETQVREVKPGSDGVIICCNAFVVGNDGTSLYNSRSPARGENVSEYFLCAGQSFVTSGILLAADLAKKIKFDERLRRHQDWDFVLRTLQAGGSYRYLDEPLLNFYDHTLDDRVSKNKDVSPTLMWFDQANYLTPRAKQFLYFSQYFVSHFKHNPIEAARVSSYLLSQDLWSSGEIFVKAISRLVYAGKSRPPNPGVGM
jgi:glycosyltransferase involved in cell wall biosynthesis